MRREEKETQHHNNLSRIMQQQRYPPGKLCFFKKHKTLIVLTALSHLAEGLDLTLLVRVKRQSP
jgi:hypothetical protein